MWLGNCVSPWNSWQRLSCPFPHSPEQHRIVAAIEAHFSRLDAAVAALRRVQANLKRYRASVLKAACEGRLVPTEAEWPTTTLAELLDEPLINGRSVPDAEHGSDGFPVLRLTALRKGRIALAERKLGAWSPTEARRFLVKRGDFYVSRGNGSLHLVGRGGLLWDAPDAVAFPDTLIRVRCNPRKITPRYLALVWDSQIVRSQLERKARTTAGIYKVNQSDLEIVAFPLPPLSEQEVVAGELERRLSVLDEVETSVTNQLARAERLRQSILKRAFEGRLVPQDPNDEPASVLLERIRAERAAALGQSPLRRSGRPARQPALESAVPPVP